MLTLSTRALVFAQAIVLTFASLAAAQIPAGYYSTATGTGSSLKSQLHNIIDGHTFFSYGAARTILQITDRDPADPDRMLLVYNRASLNVSAINPNGNIPGWDSGNSWNREHTWPRSRNVGSSGPDNSDLHQLRPSDNGINNDRGNLNFGGEYGQQSFGTVSDGGTFWYPGDADAGMIARQEFYMAVRYDGSDGSTDDLELFSGNPGTNSPRLGNLDRLIEWHYEAAPDGFERTRNDIIYSDYQGNRNPFVDHPEFVWSVFVDQSNDTRLSIAGTTPSAGGASSTTVDLGRAYVGASAPAMQSLSLDKAGTDGTYYGVTATGSATTTAGDFSRPMAMGSGVTDTFNIGLDVSTATSGEYSGSVIIDNLDVTTGGGVGRGANDGDDVIDLTYSVLDHPVASFSADTILDTATIDFGQIAIGSGLVAEEFDFFNYDGDGGPFAAADLDFDSLSSLGDDSVLSLDALLTTGILQGDGLGFDALFDTSSAGSFEAVYTFNLSGEDLPGEQTQTLSLTLLGEVIGALAGDYNSDGMVDSADYTVYRDTLGSEVDLRADGDGDGEVNSADLAIWQGAFGASSGATNAVPEPTSLLLVALAYGCLNTASRRR